MFPGPGSCDNGLVMWTPALEQSVAEANGLMVAPGSHLHFKNNLSWVQQQATSISGQVQLMKLSKHLGETSDKLFSPTLELGDVLIFNKVLKYQMFCWLIWNVKCTVHSATGVNSARRARQAWQVRFVTDPMTPELGVRKHPGMGDKWTDLNNPHMNGAKSPLLWPATIAEAMILL